MSVITNREPKALFRYFEEISAIPRMSYHEEQIADYLVDFARKRGLECYRDKAHNVFIRMPATQGYEDHAPVLLQGHTDMVCEKNNDVVHDFLQDPLKLYLDGDLLRAEGTTLGADDGIAVSVMLAVLDGALEAHPLVECLFTSAEEVGLDGAKSFDYSLLTARKMVNLDSESLGVITAGCAGGIRSEVKLPIKPIPFMGDALRFAIQGLAGGHSGENIHEGRANANKMMGRILAEIVQKCGAKLVSVNGGSKDNAIPRECEAVIAVSDRDVAESVAVELAARI
ncbi:MAG: beta-Ala-His dipeptidase, partial [Clostridia bacterium]|nr:beta-Ala-His dipeptidase [Clostridia bacterium]